MFSDLCFSRTRWATFAIYIPPDSKCREERRGSNDKWLLPRYLRGDVVNASGSAYDCTGCGGGAQLSRLWLKKCKISSDRPYGADGRPGLAECV